MKQVIILLFSITWLNISIYAQNRGVQNSNIQPCPESADVVSVMAFGAKGDGKTDDTQAFQRALDSFGTKGGTVYAPRGAYLFAGSLNVPQAVTLKGAFESVPAHNGIRDAGLPKPGETGTDRI